MLSLILSIALSHDPGVFGISCLPGVERYDCKAACWSDPKQPDGGATSGSIIYSTGKNYAEAVADLWAQQRNGCKPVKKLKKVSR